MSGGRIINDPLLGEAFFKLPAKIRNRKLSFPIPSNLNNLDDFFREQGKDYRAGVMAIVNNLQTIADLSGILDARAKTSLEIFLEKFTYNPAASNRYKESIFPLYTVGISYLADIADYYQKEKKLSETDKSRLQELLRNMNVCAGGVFTQIYETRSTLYSDLANELQSIRQEIARTTAKSFLAKQKADGNIEIPLGTLVHFENTLLSLYANKLAIAKVDGDLLKDDNTPSPILQRQYYHLLSRQFSASDIISAIMARHHERFVNLQPDTSLTAWLSSYGEDKRPIIEQIAYLDEHDAYQLKPHLDYYLMHALFTRLVNSDILNRAGMNRFELEGDATISVHIPAKNNIRLAYVEYADSAKSDEPFVLFSLAKLFQDAKHGTNDFNQLEQYLDDVQKNNLHAELKRLVAIDWLQHIKSSTTDQQVAMIRFFNQMFPEASVQLMDMLLHTDLSSDQKQSLLNELEFVDKVVDSNNIHALVAYLVFYSKEQWLDLLLTKFQGMHMLEHRPVIAIVEMLSAIDITEEQLKSILANDVLSNSIITLVSADIPIDVNMVRFLISHAADAESLATVVFVFNLYVEAKVDQELLAFLAAYDKHAKAFLACIDGSTNADEWLTHLNKRGILDLKRMKRLMNHAFYINEMIATLGDICLYDEAACHDWIDTILDKTKNKSQLSFLREVISHCKDHKVKLAKASLEAIFRHQDVYPAEINDTVIAFYAAMLGMTDLLESMIRANIISITDVLPAGSGLVFSGATLLATAIVNSSTEVCKMLLANGASGDDSIVVKISELEGMFKNGSQAVLAAFLQEKTGSTQVNPDSDITITARELATLVGDKEVLVNFPAQKIDVSVVPQSIFNATSVTDGNEPASHPQPPGFDA